MFRNNCFTHSFSTFNYVLEGRISLSEKHSIFSRLYQKYTDLPLVFSSLSHVPISPSFHPHISLLEFHPLGSFFASVSTDGSTSIHNFVTALSKYHKSEECRYNSTNNDDSCQNDNIENNYYYTNSSEPIHTIKGNGLVHAMHWHPINRNIIALSNKYIHLYDLSSNNPSIPSTSFCGPSSSALLDFSFLPGSGGRVLIAGGRAGQTAYLWDTRQKYTRKHSINASTIKYEIARELVLQKTKRSQNHHVGNPMTYHPSTSPIKSVQLTRDGYGLYYITEDGNIHIWDLRYSPQQVKSLNIWEYAPDNILNLSSQSRIIDNAVFDRSDETQLAFGTTNNDFVGCFDLITHELRRVYHCGRFITDTTDLYQPCLDSIPDISHQIWNPSENIPTFHNTQYFLGRRQISFGGQAERAIMSFGSSNHSHVYFSDCSYSHERIDNSIFLVPRCHRYITRKKQEKTIITNTRVSAPVISVTMHFTLPYVLYGMTTNEIGVIGPDIY